MSSLKVPERKPHRARVPETLARDAGLRLFARSCDRMGVSGFDWPTFAAYYPFRARVIRETGRNLRAQGGA